MIYNVVSEKNFITKGMSLTLTMKLGARIFKTGIAITLALFLAELLGLSAPAFAGIAAIFAIQPSIYRSYLTVLDQLQGNIIGALVAVIFSLTLGNHPLVIGLTAILVITINLRLKSQNIIPLSLVTVIAIMESTTIESTDYALLRFSTVMLGVLSAFIVNFIFLPPKYETKLYYKLTHITEDIIKWIRMTLREASAYTLLKEDIEKIEDRLKQTEQTFDFYKEERKYSKKNAHVKSRKLVLFRQMLLTTKRALTTLRLLHRLGNDIHHMPEKFQTVLKEQTEYILSYHEQTLLKFIGKVRAQQPHKAIDPSCTGKRGLIDTFMKYKLLEDEDENKMLYNLFPLISSIIEYGEEVEHLDLLIDSFQSYHTTENSFEISGEEEN